MSSREWELGERQKDRKRTQGVFKSMQGRDLPSCLLQRWNFAALLAGGRDYFFYKIPKTREGKKEEWTGSQGPRADYGEQIRSMTKRPGGR